jgi:hypothetical protein
MSSFEAPREKKLSTLQSLVPNIGRPKAKTSKLSAIVQAPKFWSSIYRQELQIMLSTSMVKAFYLGNC